MKPTRPPVASRPKCRHTDRSVPLYSEARKRQWFVCNQCGMVAWRRFGEKRVRKWQTPKSGKAFIDTLFPDERLTAELEKP